jgi:CDGSH-type Zn-finger protein
VKIKVVRGGPYLVQGGVPLAVMVIVRDIAGNARSWRLDKTYPAQANYALCRCGASANMPFCDGTHRKIGFVGAETASHTPYLEQAERTVGPALELTDADALCAGAGFCHRAGGTWNLTEQSDDPSARRLAIEEACDCPSGRLVTWDTEGHPVDPPLEPSIAVVEDPGIEVSGVSGPFWVRGGIPIEGADGRTYERRNRVTLCRCGKSRNKPFCDASHQA